MSYTAYDFEDITELNRKLEELSKYKFEVIAISPPNFAFNAGILLVKFTN